MIFSCWWSYSFWFSWPFWNSQKNITSSWRNIDTLYLVDIHPIDWEHQETFIPTLTTLYRAGDKEKLFLQTNILTSDTIQVKKKWSIIHSNKNQYYLQRDDKSLFESYFSLTTIPDSLVQLKYHLWAEEFYQKWDSGNIYLYGSEHICDEQQVIYDWGKNIRYCRKWEKNPLFLIQNSRQYYTYSTSINGKHTFQFFPVSIGDIFFSFEEKKLPEYILIDTPRDIIGMQIKYSKNGSYSWATQVVKKYKIYQYQNTKIILPYYEIPTDLQHTTHYLHLDFVQVQPLDGKNKNVQSDTYSDAFGITFEVY